MSALFVVMPLRAAYATEVPIISDSVVTDSVPTEVPATSNVTSDTPEVETESSASTGVYGSNATTQATTSDSNSHTTASQTSSSSALFSIPELSEAQAAMVIDSGGNVLYSLNPEAEFNMASITKIMTAVVALESGISLDTTLTCQGSVLDANAQVAGYAAGQSAVFSDLLKVMLVYSANDAAYEVACAVAGSEEAFVELMNKKALELGMTHTSFQNSHGLDAEGHYSCVSDLVKLARYALSTYSFISDTVSCDAVTVPINGVNVTFESTDEFLRTYAGALGIKTGLGNETSCFLGAARRDGLTLYSCVLGCETKQGRFSDTYTLMDAAFNTAEQKQFTTSGKTIYTKPFAYHFGFACEVSCDVTSTGYVYSNESIESSHSNNSSNEFLEPDQICEVVQWSQEDRVVSTALYKSSTKLTVARSGFGLAGELSGLDVDCTYSRQDT